uniref:Uncharacterized protein n=2 Tax=Oryza TaxID=4527 RepID=A0A0D3GDT4_9ORYZ
MPSFSVVGIVCTASYSRGARRSMVTRWVARREKLVGQLRGVGSEEVHRLWELVEDLVGSVAHVKRILSAAAHAGRTSLAPALLGGEAHRGLRTRGEARRRSHTRDGLGWLHARFQSFLPLLSHPSPSLRCPSPFR